jgi:single-stranded-DNA-specific exonuclease
MVIPENNIDEFRNKINLFARESLNIQDLIPSMDIDMELSFSELNMDLILEMKKLEPFGVGNPEPLFYTKNLMLKGQPRLYSRDTLKFWVTDGDLTYSAIGFGMGALLESLVNAEKLDLVYFPKIDSWQGQESPILEVKEIFFK